MKIIIVNRTLRAIENNPQYNLKSKKRKVKIMRGKKGVSEMWWILATAFIVIVVVILVLLWFKGGSEKGIGVITSQLDDDDGDGVKNVFDHCPDTSAEVPVDVVGCSEPQQTALGSSANPL